MLHAGLTRAPTLPALQYFPTPLDRDPRTIQTCVFFRAGEGGAKAIDGQGAPVPPPLSIGSRDEGGLS